MTTWEEIRDEVAGTLADGQPLEDVIAKLEKLKNKMEKPMTNEEYLKSCDTEQLAKEIYGFVWCCNELWQQLCCNGDGTDEESDLRIVRKWLKQPHSKGVANEND